MLRERVNVADFESDRFAANLVERLGWAVSDAAEAERDGHALEADAEPESDVEETDADSAQPADRRVPEPV